MLKSFETWIGGLRLSLVLITYGGWWQNVPSQWTCCVFYIMYFVTKKRSWKCGHFKLCFWMLESDTPSNKTRATHFGLIGLWRSSFSKMIQSMILDFMHNWCNLLEIVKWPNCCNKRSYMDKGVCLASSSLIAVVDVGEIL